MRTYRLVRAWATTFALCAASTFVSVVNAAAATSLKHVHVYWTENGQFQDRLYVLPGASISISRDSGTPVEVRIFKADGMGTVTYSCNDINNAISRSVTSSDLYESFTNCVGTGDTDVWASVNTLEGRIQIRITNIQPATPDLTVSNVTVNSTTVPRDYAVGETVHIGGIVWNVGKATAAASTLGYYLGSSSSDIANRVGSDGVGSLSGTTGSAETLDYTFAASDVGSTRYFVFKADYLNVVSEGTNEGNNLASFGPFRVVGNAPPVAGALGQARGDTFAPLSFGSVIQESIGVFFKTVVNDTDGDTSRLEVELRPIGEGFTGTATITSVYVSSGSTATTATLSGLTPGAYHWRGRVVDSRGLASSWQDVTSPAFTVAAANVAPTVTALEQARTDTGGLLNFGESISQGVSVFFTAKVTDPDGDLGRLEVELRPTAESFSGAPSVLSTFIVSGTTATTPVIAAPPVGEYKWRARATDSRGNAGVWVDVSSPSFKVVSCIRPVAPVLVTSRNYVNAKDTYRFDWSQPPFATRYILQQSTDPLFKSPSTIATVEHTYTSHADLTTSTPIYLRVAADNQPCGLSSGFSNVEGVVIVAESITTWLSHGFQEPSPGDDPPDWVVQFTSRISANVGQPANYFNWKAQSNNSGGGWAEAAGEQLAARIAQSDPLAERLHHLVGHSLGTVVVSEAARRLLSWGYKVPQLTLLDAVDGRVETGPGSRINPTIGVWEGLSRVDNYWGNGGTTIPGVILHGHNVEGAINSPQMDRDHTTIHDYYFDTILDPLIRREGWYWSRNGGGWSASDAGRREKSDRDGKVPTIFNGDFDFSRESPYNGMDGRFAGYEWEACVGSEDINCDGGTWQNRFGYRRVGIMERAAGNNAAVMPYLVFSGEAVNAPRLEHAPVWVPAGRTALKFALRIETSSDEDELSVSIVERGVQSEVLEIPCRGATSDFQLYEVDISSDAGRMLGVVFTLRHSGNGVIRSRSWIDDIHLGTPSSVAAAAIATPVPGTTISSTDVEFAWSTGTGVSAYWLYVGSAPGGSDIYGAPQALSRTRIVKGIALSGRPIFVRLYSRINDRWDSYRDYVFQTASATMSRIVDPTPGAMLGSKDQNFSWSAGIGVNYYWLDIGTARGASNLYSASQGSMTSQTVTGLPTDGRQIFVRLYSKIGDTMPFEDYVYTAANNVVPAKITAPAPGTVLTSSTPRFEWDAGAGVSRYYLAVGTAPGGSDIFGANVGTDRARTVTILRNGRTIYVRVYSAVGDTWLTTDASYTAPEPAALAQVASPSPGTRLSGDTVTFQWSSGGGVERYWLSVGRQKGGTDIYDGMQGTARSRTVSGLPDSGGQVWVRLYSDVGSWQFIDYAFTAADLAAPASLTSPTPGSTLSGASVLFQWSGGAGVSRYWVSIGSAPGAYDLYSQNQGTATSTTVTALPMDGRPVYVRLYSIIHDEWRASDASYVSATDSRPRITAPTSSTLPGSTATFSWTGGPAGTVYSFEIGNTLGANDIYSFATGPSRTTTVPNLPTDGRTLYVRVSSQYGSADATYRAALVTEVGAITNPAPGSRLLSSTVTFEWSSGQGASRYWLYVGTARGGSDLYNAAQGTNRSRTISGLPTTGRTLFVRLYSFMDASDSWEFADYTFTSATTTALAEMTSPAPGSTLTGSATFEWSTGAGVSRYWLYVGSARGGSDIYGAAQGTNRSRTVSNLPTDGRSIFVRLYSNINDEWQFIDYSYTAATIARPEPATLTGPAPGSTLTGASATFQWTAGVGVNRYWLYVGSARGGADIYDSAQGNSLSRVVNGLPVDGRRIWVRLYSNISEDWTFIDTSFTAANLSVAAQLISPTPGPALTSSSVTFTWNSGVGVSRYWLYVGTVRGGDDIYGGAQGTSLSRTVSGLPAGRTIYVRLYSNINDTWVWTDYAYDTRPTPSGPAQVETLPGSLTWRGQFDPKIYDYVIVLNATVTPSSYPTTFYWQWTDASGNNPSTAFGVTYDVGSDPIKQTRTASHTISTSPGKVHCLRAAADWVPSGGVRQYVYGTTLCLTAPPNTR